jgi:neutral ceramidase
MMFLAGAAHNDINPKRPVYLTGYPKTDRISTGIHDPLLVSVLYLFDGEVALLFVALDLLMLSHQTVHRCREMIQAATAIPAGNILISASHTHSGPVMVDLLAFRHDPFVPPVDPAYIDFVCAQIVSTAVQAKASAVPARAAFSTAQVESVGGNRHTVNGPRDPQAGLFYLEEAASCRPLALSIIYSMHPTVLHEDSKLVSADFPGYTRLYLAERMGGATILYHNGPCGNLSPRYHVKEQTFAEAQRLGERLGEFVLDAIKTLAPDDFIEHLRLSALQGWVELPRRVFPPVVEAKLQLEQAQTNFEHLQASNAPRAEVRTAEVTVFGAEERIYLAQAQERGEIATLQADYTPVEIQVLHLGETCFVGLPGELFVEYSLEIKRRASKQTFVISLANGELQGYIVTPGAEGYEAAFSLFAPDAGRVLVEETMRLLAAK